jgi:hypothetical protein
MEAGLVDVAALGRHQGGAVTRGETVSRVVETDELGGALRGQADLGPEPGPQTLAAPPGLGRERIAECQQQWMGTLEQAAQDAHAQGQLPAGSDPQQLAFELEGALLTANWYFHLYADPSYLNRARRAVQACLASHATPAGRRALPAGPADR